MATSLNESQVASRKSQEKLREGRGPCPGPFAFRHAAVEERVRLFDTIRSCRQREPMKLFRILLVVIVAALGVAALLVVRQRQKLAAMSNDEIRAMLEGKLSGKVDDEQLVRIQEMVIAKVRGGQWSSSSAAAITGTVSYRESDPMPPSAVIIVTLADTSVTDATAGQIGAHVIEQPRTVPVDFSVGFDPADIIDNHSYTV